jgi:hypothetical protein
MKGISEKHIFEIFGEKSQMFGAPKICLSTLRYTKRRPEFALPDTPCHETTYFSGFRLFGCLVFSAPLRGRFFGFDDAPHRRTGTGT